MSKEKPYSSYRWNTPPIVEVVEEGKPQTKEERIKSKKMLLDILVKNKEMTRKEADNRIKEFIEELNK